MAAAQAPGLRVFISAGEASGDALGAGVIEALQAIAPGVETFGMGGPRMIAAGFEPWRDAGELGVVGLVEVLRHLPRLLRLLGALADRAIRARPDLAILIDVPDFNLRLARRLKAAGIPVAFYVGPSVWAWRAGRVRKFRAAVDRMMVLFPFETEVWARGGVDVVCVGHPLVDEIPRAAPDTEAEPATVALLPGSRRSEIARHLDTMLEAAAELADRGLARRFVLPLAPGLDRESVLGSIRRSRIAGQVELIEGAAGDPAPRRRAIARAAIALVASGTAALETALIGRPQVIVYRVSWVSYWIARSLARIQYLGLGNIILGRELSPELLQARFSAPRLAAAAARLLEDPEAKANTRRGYEELRGRLGTGGAARRAAVAALELLQRRSGT